MTNNAIALYKEKQMMNVNKKWMLIMIAVLMIFGVAACGEKESKPEQQPPVTE